MRERALASSLGEVLTRREVSHDMEPQIKKRLREQRPVGASIQAESASSCFLRFQHAQKANRREMNRQNEKQKGEGGEERLKRKEKSLSLRQEIQLALDTHGAVKALSQMTQAMEEMTSSWTSPKDRLSVDLRLYRCFRKAASKAVDHFHLTRTMLNAYPGSKKGSASEFVYFWGTVLLVAHKRVEATWFLEKSTTTAEDFPRDVTPSQSDSPDLLQNCPPAKKLIYALRECVPVHHEAIRATMLAYARNWNDEGLGDGESDSDYDETEDETESMDPLSFGFFSLLARKRKREKIAEEEDDEETPRARHLSSHRYFWQVISAWKKRLDEEEKRV